MREEEPAMTRATPAETAPAAKADLPASPAAPAPARRLAFPGRPAARR